MWILNQFWGAIKWAYSDSLRYLGFLFAITAIASFVIILVSYTWQTLGLMLLCFVVYAVFVFFDEIGR